MIRSQTRDKFIKQSLTHLLGRVSSEVWIGELTQRVSKKIEKDLISDSTSDSVIGYLGRTISVSKFYYICKEIKSEINFFEIYRKKNLTFIK